MVWVFWTLRDGILSLHDCNVRMVSWLKFANVPIPCRWDANDAGMTPAKLWDYGHSMDMKWAIANQDWTMGEGWVKNPPAAARMGLPMCRYWWKILGSRRFPEMGLPPIAGWFIMDDLGLPPWLRKPPNISRHIPRIYVLQFYSTISGYDPKEYHV